MNKSIFFYGLLFIFLFSSCLSPRNDKAHDISGNGSEFVKYDDKIYFWEYNPDSFINEGLFKYYELNRETQNRLVYITPDLSKHTLLNDVGYGSIYIINDEMFYQKDYDLIGSISTDGKKKGELPGYILYGNDRYLVWNDYSGDQLQVLDAASKKTSAIDTSGLGEFVILAGDNIYFSEVDSYELTIYCHNLINGSNNTVCNIKQPVDEFASEYFFRYVNEPYIIDNYLLFTFGYEAGTGHFWQGGMLVCVNLTDNAVKVLDDEAGRLFCAWKTDDKTNVYYNGNYDETDEFEDIYTSLINEDENYGRYNSKIEIESGEITHTYFSIERPGRFFSEEGCIYACLDNTGTKTMLLNARDAQYDPAVLSVIDDWVYYKDEFSQRTPESDIGWREGFERIKTDVYRINLRDREKQYLYSY